MPVATSDDESGVSTTFPGIVLASGATWTGPGLNLYGDRKGAS
jgi:hypothetical protein